MLWCLVLFAAEQNVSLLSIHWSSSWKELIHVIIIRQSYFVRTCAAVRQTKPCLRVAQLAFVEGFPLSCPLGPKHDHSALRWPRWWKGGGRRGWNDGSGGENGRRRMSFVFLWPSVAYTIHPVHKLGLHCCLLEARFMELASGKSVNLTT